MAGLPTVGIGVPVYNGARFLEESLSSALAQTYPVAELRLYDNASTDDTVEVARRLLSADQVVEQERNQGAVHNFNLAARSASTDLFMWLASDDRLDPAYVERCVAALDAHPEAPACLTGIRFIDPAGQTTRTTQDPLLASPDPAVRLRAFLRRRRWTEFYCLYRRESLLRSPLMSTEYGADVLMTWWFLLRAPLVVVPESLLEYREYPAKSVAETAESLQPGAAHEDWRMRRLWTRLGELTREPGVDPAVAALARRELRLATLHPTWWLHLGTDVTERFPRLDRGLRRVWRRLGSPGRIAPPA